MHDMYNIYDSIFQHCMKNNAHAGTEKGCHWNWPARNCCAEKSWMLLMLQSGLIV